MKPPRSLLIAAYAFAGFTVAFLFLFWLIFRWLHWGYTMWLVDSGDWLPFDGSFSVLFGLLIAAVPYAACLAYPVGEPDRRRGALRALLWSIAAVVSFAPCLWYQRHMEVKPGGPSYPDSVLVWPVLYYLVAAISAVLLTGWAVGRRRINHGGPNHVV